jgi:hypothetical protein
MSSAATQINRRIKLRAMPALPLRIIADTEK